MTKIPIDEAPAGPAMDAVVAKVLGLNEFNDWPERWEHIISHNWNEMSYSTDIAAAWGLWSYLWAEWHYAKLTFIKDLRVKACLYRDAEAVQRANPMITAIAKNGQLAICRAFLQANGVEYVEVPE